ncbi:MAG: SDR family oxidoreductase [Candidatus Hydrogenedentes bacterium]|nr:SDR family oxidoreductase [Candidatus Hydrogenedentota bacterium]
MPLVLPEMYRQNWGRLVGLSMARDEKISPGHGFSYCVGKAARTDALRMMAAQAWEHGVTVNVIAPGPVSPIQTLEEAVEQCAHGPAWAGRANVSPQDIAEGVAFLCSDGGRYITGAEFPYRFSG